MKVSKKYPFVLARLLIPVKNLRVTNKPKGNRLVIDDVLNIPNSEKEAAKKVGSRMQYNKWSIKELNYKIEDNRVEDEWL